MQDTQHQDVLAVVARINQAWTTGHVADMAECLHEDIVMAGPGFGARESGRQRCVRGYDEFAQRAAIVEFNDRDHQVDIIGDTAVVAYDFELVTVSDNGRHRATGKDLWVLRKGEAGWQAIWRTLLDIEDAVV